jgi:hypothetical protein
VLALMKFAMLFNQDDCLLDDSFNHLYFWND